MSRDLEPLRRLIAFCEQTARDGILPSRTWFTETADELKALLVPLAGPVDASREPEFVCGNDMGQVCREFWPGSPGSWCNGCVNRELHEAAQWRAHGVQGVAATVKASPDDWPAARLVTPQELRTFLSETIAAAAAVPSPRFDPSNHHNALVCPYCNPNKLNLAPPSSPVADVEVIVNGQPVTVAAGTVRAVIEEAIRRSGQIGAPVAQWQLRTTEGDIIPHNLTDGTDYELTPGRRLWLNLGPPSSRVADTKALMHAVTMACGVGGVTPEQQRASWREVARIARELAGDDQAAANDRKDP